jgi:serine/threonine-protein kinase
MGAQQPIALIVEDDEDIRDALEEVASVANGLAALVYLRDAVQLPSVILLDLMMPVMDGWQFLERRGDAFGSIPDLGVTAVLMKPVRMRTLIDVINRLAGMPATGRPRFAGRTVGPGRCRRAFTPTCFVYREAVRMADADDDPRIGSVLDDRYRIDARLSSGGMGTVYRATRLGLDRPVAIKFLHADVVGRRDLIERFEREALAMSRLSHPHCVPVIDFGVADAPFLVLEYVAGETLGAVIARGPLPLPRALAILRQVLAALAHAHAQGVIHRDIKPDNIVLADVEGAGDHARLLDFGLAKLSDSESASWSTASVAVGTPSYMSPEQARGETVDARTDLYSCGIVLFEMLTGAKPFVADRPLEVLRMHLEEPPPRLAGVSPTRRFPAELEALVAGLLEKDPQRRHRDARATIDALDAIERLPGFSEPPLIIEASKRRRDDAVERDRPVALVSEPPRSAWPTIALVASAAVALVIAVVAAVIWFGGDLDPAEPKPSSTLADAAPRALPPPAPDARAPLVAPLDASVRPDASIDARPMPPPDGAPTIPDAAPAEPTAPPTVDAAVTPAVVTPSADASIGVVPPP